ERVDRKRNQLRILACLARHGRANRTADAGSAKAAVPVGILGEVLLVVVLGVEKLGRRKDFSRDRAEPRHAQALLKRVARSLGGSLLGVSVRVNARPVLRADVVALAHALGGIVI